MKHRDDTRGVDLGLARAIVEQVKHQRGVRSSQQLCANLAGGWSNEQIQEAIEFLHDTNVIAFDTAEGWTLGTRML